jgi:hypothetical protein
VREGCEHAADAAVRLTEVARAESASSREIEHVLIDCWSTGFHQVEHERVASAVVDVRDPQARIEANDQASDPRLSLKERIEVIEQRVQRGDGEPRAAREWSAPLLEPVPMCGDVLLRGASKSA